MRKLIVLLIVAIFAAAVPAYAHYGYADAPLVSTVQLPSPGTIRGFDPQPDPPRDPLRIIAGDGSV